jgi:hypothetical protein
MSLRLTAPREAVLALVLAVAVAASPAHAAGPPTKAPAKAATKPVAPATIATVLGQKLTRNDFGPVPPVLAQMAGGDAAKLAALNAQWEDQALTGLVLGALLDRFGKQKGIAPTNAEVSEVLAVLSKVEQRAAARPDTTDPTVRGGAVALVGRFKIHAALYAQYGGRVFLDRQSGPLPFDAYRRLLEAEKKAGSYTITPAWEKRFWATLSEDAGRQFVPAAEAKAAISQPWWRGPGGSTTK